MGFGGVLSQAAYDSRELDAAVRSLVGQLLGFLAVVAFGIWLMRRSRTKRSDRPPPSGWYADPWGGPVQRWWNGANWTGHVRPDPAAAYGYGPYGAYGAPGSSAPLPGSAHPPPAGPPSPGASPTGEPSDAPWGSPPPGGGPAPGA